jgi:hypothetical protein
MTTEPLTDNPTQQLKQIRLVWTALFFGLLIFSSIVVVINRISGPFIQEPKYEKVLLGLFGLVAVICLLIAPFRFNRTLKKKINVDSPLTQKLEHYKAAQILYLALCEGPAALSIAGFLLTGKYFFGIIVLVCLGMYFIKYPSKNKIFEELKLDTSERMQLE